MPIWECPYELLLKTQWNGSRLLDRACGGPFGATDDELLDVGCLNGFAIVPKSFMENAAFAVFESECQRLGFIAPIGVRSHEHMNRSIAFELGVEFVVCLKIVQALGDGIFCIFDLGFENAARTVAGFAHDPVASRIRL